MVIVSLCMATPIPLAMVMLPHLIFLRCSRYQTRYAGCDCRVHLIKSNLLHLFFIMVDLGHCNGECVYMYIVHISYTYMHIHTYIHTYQVHTTHTCIQTHMHAYTHACSHLHIHMCTCTDPCYCHQCSNPTYCTMRRVERVGNNLTTDASET